MRMIFQEETYRCLWHDDAETIVVFEIMARWSWDDAHDAIKRLNNVISTVQHPICTILHFHDGANIIPSGANALPTLKYLMSIDPPQEKLVVLVAHNKIIEILLNTIGKAYGLSDTLKKYRYTDTLESALALIESSRERGVV